MTSATSLLPDDILSGMPIARLGRWQPLRAGIVGIFRYDIQEFIFYNGRLLLRGANGSGKSMALEVLLPYLLDADMSPERLSTFGGRSRGMFTWLLGHDKTAARDSARGYVWIEFGRVGTNTEPEYFTAGAGLEATRASNNVNAWYFTTTARIGKEIPPFRRGVEPPKKDSLATILAETEAAGFPGRIRKPEEHRNECNRVLYGLDGYKYEALRKALTQLRRPKLSDQLSEKGLAAILRDALAPMDPVLITSIADGYERLDRHREDVQRLGKIRSELRKLERVYGDYARAALHGRAKAIIDLEIATKSAATKAQELATEMHSCESRISEESSALDKVKQLIEGLTGRIEGLKEKDEYKEGKDLEPLLASLTAQEKAVKALEDAAKTAQKTAGAEELIASQLDTDAQKAKDTAAFAATAATEAANRAIIVAAAHADLVADVWQASNLSPTLDVDDLRARLEETTDYGRNYLKTLQRLADTAQRAHETAENAAQQAVEAELALQDAAAKRATAEQEVGVLLTRLVDDARRWLTDSVQLQRGQAAPEFTVGNVETEPAAWARRAERGRREQLTAVNAALLLTEQSYSALSERLSVARSAAASAHALLTDANTAADAARQAEQAWRSEVAGWLEESSEFRPRASAPPAPGTDADPSEWAAWVVTASRANADARGRQQAALQEDRTAANAAATPLEAETEALNEELAALQAGRMATPPEPPIGRADRTGRRGAPLYVLIDFRDLDLDPYRTAQLEAAIVASGLADAWIAPDGALITTDGSPLCDTQLVPDGPPAPSPLSAAVCVDALGAATVGVPVSMVASLLDQISLAETITGLADATVGVAWDGSWRAGALHGAHQQGDAYLIGAASRERSRQRRITEIEARLDALSQSLAPLRQQLKDLAEAEAELQRSAQRADDQADAFPDHSAMLEAAVKANIAREKATTACATIEPALRDITVQIGRLRRLATRAVIAAVLGGLAEEPESTADAAEPPAGWQTDEELLAVFDRLTEDAAEVLANIAHDVDEAATTLQAHYRALSVEVDAQPQATDLSAAKSVEVEALAIERSAQQTCDRLMAAERQARTKEHHARSASEAALAEANLADHAENLTEIERLLSAWISAVTVYLQRLQRAQELAQQARTAAHKAEQVRVAAGDAVGKVISPKNEAVRARAKYEAAYRRLSHTFIEIEGEIHQLEAQLHIQTEKLGALERSLPHRHGAYGKAQARSEEANRTLQELRDQMPARAEALITACQAELPEAGGWTAPDPQYLDTSPALNIAGHIMGQAGSQADIIDLETAVNKTTAVRHDAEALLGNRVTLTEQWSAGLFVIQAKRASTNQSLRATAQEIQSELIVAETVIQREEAELLEQFLTADVRRQVTARIDGARKQNKAMNNLMSSHGTSSGVQVMLKWVPDPASGGFSPDVVDLLDAEFDVSPSSKTRLAAFFKARIASLRAQQDGRSWRELLAEMLDYRRWYRYEIMYKYPDGGWTRLSSTEHGALSGGEKSVALHLPLFAAAANHTAASAVRDTADPTKPGCPRLILLDEVFAGISDDNRGALFDLVTTLEMDLIATSEAETGMYAELDGVAIYHLIKQQNLPGILAVRSVWDGLDSHNLLDNDMDRDGF